MAISDLPEAPTTLNMPGPACTVCRVLADLPDTEATALAALLSNNAWRYQELSDALAAEGHDLPAQALSRHARGRCAARVKLR